MNDILQLLEENGIEVTFSKMYKAPYIHRHTVNPFIRIVQETYVDTRRIINRRRWMEILNSYDRDPPTTVPRHDLRKAISLKIAPF
ncbi:hypothetical protein ACF0H5_001885 [Mactra antiquata]